MALQTQLQILDKSDYKKQFILSPPKDFSPPPLNPGSVRIQTKILTLSANVLTYARLGNFLGSWDAWAVAPWLAPPYNDTSKYGGISSWGYVEVIESMNDQISVGSKLFGIVPIGNYPEVLEVEVEKETGHAMEISQRRANLLEIYNRYVPWPPETDLSIDRDSRGWDSNMKVLFETSYLLNRYTFSWNGKPAHPFGTQETWNENDANLSNSVVFLFGPSGKTGLSFAHQLRHARPADKRPRKIVAVGSAQSQSFSKATDLFDDIILYADSSKSDVLERLGIDKNTKTLVAEFSVRGDADFKCFTALKNASDNVKAVLVGSDPTSTGVSEMGALLQDPTSGVVRCHASKLRDFAKAYDGKAEYFKNMEENWAHFKERGLVNGLKLKWGKGMDDFKEGWSAFCSGISDPTSSLVYEI